VSHVVKKPELLIPAGCLERLKYAFAYGADAVYAGAPQFSLRVRENSFSEENIMEGIAYAKEHNKKFYLTVNVLAHNRKIKPFINKLEAMIAARPDALIMADLGLIDIVRNSYPDMPIHVSVQTNTMNWAAVQAWKKMGVTRIILSREVSIEEMKEIRQRVPDIELEAFVHGAVCVAHSGRCLLSNYFSYRDANDGCCTNACRWKYRLREQKTHRYFLQEAHRPDDCLEIEEDEQGTYILNAKDLRAVEHISELVAAGVDSMKVEGRNKSLYYVAVVTRAYRKAIDDVMAGKSFDAGLIAELNKIHNRGYTSGFLVTRAGQESIRYDEGLTNLYTQEFSAVILDQKPGHILVTPRNRLCVGDAVEIMTSQQSFRCRVEGLVTEDGLSVAAIHGGTDVRVWMPYEGGPLPPFSIISKIV